MFYEYSCNNFKYNISNINLIIYKYGNILLIIEFISGI